jgi:hypothetical protein
VLLSLTNCLALRQIQLLLQQTHPHAAVLTTASGFTSRPTPPATSQLLSSPANAKTPHVLSLLTSISSAVADCSSPRFNSPPSDLFQPFFLCSAVLLLAPPSISVRPLKLPLERKLLCIGTRRAHSSASHTSDAPGKPYGRLLGISISIADSCRCCHRTFIQVQWADRRSGKSILHRATITKAPHCLSSSSQLHLQPL